MASTSYASFWECYHHQASPRGDRLSAPLMDGLHEHMGSLRHRRILEFGCGDGLILEAISKDAPSSYGCDISHLALTKAAARRGRFELRNNRYASIPFPDGFFDAVVFVKSLSTIADSLHLSSVLAETQRTLRPFGWVFLIDYAFSPGLRDQYYYCGFESYRYACIAPKWSSIPFAHHLPGALCERFASLSYHTTEVISLDSCNNNTSRGHFTTIQLSGLS